MWGVGCGGRTAASVDLTQKCRGFVGPKNDSSAISSFNRIGENVRIAIHERHSRVGNRPQALEIAPNENPSTPITPRYIQRCIQHGHLISQHLNR